MQRSSPRPPQNSPANSGDEADSTNIVIADTSSGSDDDLVVTDETRPLLSINDAAVNAVGDDGVPAVVHPAPQRRKTSAASAAVQLTLGVIGLGTGLMYLGPAKSTATESDAGIWLSKLVGKDVATGVFTAGGLDWASVNAYFSSKSVQSFIEYMRKQPSVAAQLAKGGSIILYVVSQDVSQYIISSQTSGSTFEMVATIAGNTPGALFAGVGLMENELPYLARKISAATMQARYGIARSLSPLSPADKLARARLIHYRQQHQAFLTNTRANWRYVVGHVRDLKTDPNASALDTVFGKDVFGVNTSHFDRFAKQFGRVAGTALTSSYTAAFAVNTVSTIAPFVPSLPLQILVMAFLQSSAFYGNVRVGIHGVQGALKAFFNVLRGKPIDSLMFQVRPKTTLAALAATIPLSAFSYTVADFMFLNQFPGSAKNGVLKILRYTANGSMSFYHISGLMHFFMLMYAMATPDKQEQTLFAIEKEIERFGKMSVNEFITFVDGLSVDQRMQYFIAKFVDPATLSAAEAAVASTSTTSAQPASSGLSLFAKEGLNEFYDVEKQQTVALKETDDIINEFTRL